MNENETQEQHPLMTLEVELRNAIVTACSSGIPVSMVAGLLDTLKFQMQAETFGKMPPLLNHRL